MIIIALNLIVLPSSPPLLQAWQNVGEEQKVEKRAYRSLNVILLESTAGVA